MIKEYVKNIKKIFKMSLIDLKKNYKGAALGWIWVIAKPAVTIFMYWFLFEIGLRVGKDVNDIPYYMWLIVGLLPWFYISDVISYLPSSYKKYNYLVNKVKFPISTIPIFTSLSRFLVNIFLTIIVIIMYVLILKRFDIYFITLLFYMIFMFIFESIVSSILALISSVSKDIANLIKTLQTPLLFLSPIFWSLDSINIKFVKIIQLFNPISYFVTGYKDAFIYKIHFYNRPLEMIVMIIVFVLLVILNKKLYKKISKVMPDYL
jgi:ABC-type polysaccharide/polyol phosphate export permease